MSIQYSSTDGPGDESGAIMFQQAQAGDLVSLNQLMSRHDGLVQAMVRRQVLGDLPFTEALQAGRIGLWRAILGYDPARGFAFSTYACPCIMRQVWRAVKLFARSQAGAQSSEGMPLPDIPNPVAVHEAAAVREALYALVSRLPRRLRYVIVARYGLDGQAPAWFYDIGAALGILARPLIIPRNALPCAPVRPLREPEGWRLRRGRSAGEFRWLRPSSR